MLLDQWTRNSSRVDQVGSRTATDLLAGSGRLFSSIRIEKKSGIETMQDRTDTAFNDIVVISGSYSSFIPIAIAIFPYRVEGSFREDFHSGAIDGELHLQASFRAIAISSDQKEMESEVRTLAGPMNRPVLDVLSPSVMFKIGQPIAIDATLKGQGRSRTSRQDNEHHHAVLPVESILDPIIVINVTNPSISSLSGTQYRISPNVPGVPLLDFEIKFIQDRLSLHES